MPGAPAAAAAATPGANREQALEDLLICLLFFFFSPSPPDRFKSREETRARAMRPPPPPRRRQRLPRACAGKAPQLCPSRHGASRRSQLKAVINNRKWGSSSPHMFCSFLTRSHQPFPLFPGREPGPGPPSPAEPPAEPRLGCRSRAEESRAEPGSSLDSREMQQSWRTFQGAELGSVCVPAGRKRSARAKNVFSYRYCTGRFVSFFSPPPVPLLSAPGAQCPPQTGI